MRLKDYQIRVLEDLSVYLQTLSAKRKTAESFVAFQLQHGEEAELPDYCSQTWKALEDSLPPVIKADQTVVHPPYVARHDGSGRPIPNVCLKLPTGGGKTLLASIALDRINTEYFGRQTGLVLWIVPSEPIYKQTWRALANREHPYRQMLERASGGRVKMLEKRDPFTDIDVQSQLCVMLMMLQAGSVRRESKNSRKMFQDSGKYPTFFPEVDDQLENEAMLAEVPNLDVADLLDRLDAPPPGDNLKTLAPLSPLRGEGSGERGARFGGFGNYVYPKHSLGNVLRLVRPIVVIDEGHKAYSDTALDTICGYNPKFILELSATPNANEHVSNVVVNVAGGDLKDEQMIKLPINVENDARADWKHALASAKSKLDDLQVLAEKVRGNENRYIRPILLVRVERTGKDQRDKDNIHSEDVREYLIENLGATEEEIKVKSSELDELAEVDQQPEYKGQGLLSDLCPVRYVITKDALREGWDCPFAYILASLSRTTAATAITQMVGRVLRQPHASFTDEPELNECYVFTHDADVQEAVENVRKGLQSEGMGDLADGVRASGTTATGSKRTKITRRDKFKGVRVFMPRVLSKHAKTKSWRPFDYERDLLPRLDWSRMSFRKAKTFVPDPQDRLERTRVRIDVANIVDNDPVLAEVESADWLDPTIDVPAMSRLLLDIIPNPWQSSRIVQESLATLRGRDISEARIFTNRLFMMNAIKEDLKQQINEAGEAEFRQMLSDGDLSFQLVSKDDPQLNWELAETLSLDVSDEDKVLTRKNATPLEKSLFDPIYQKEINHLEKDVAWYLDVDQAVQWWHRISVKQDWHLQGWQRGRIYPDFLMCMEGDGSGVIRFKVLETKGLHLKGNEDTEYKQRLFDLLSETSSETEAVGELLLQHDKHQIRFDMLFENDWRDKLGQIVGNG